MEFHIPTMFVMLVAGCITLAVSALAASERHAGDGLREWGLALCIHEHCRGSAKPVEKPFLSVNTRRSQQGVYCQQGKAHICRVIAQKTREPLRSCRQADVRGKHHVSRAKKHGEQGRPNHKGIAHEFFVHKIPVVRVLQGPALCRGTVQATRAASNIRRRGRRLYGQVIFFWVRRGRRSKIITFQHVIAQVRAKNSTLPFIANSRAATDQGQ